MPAPYGVVDSGFNRKRLPEILESLNTGVQGVFGANTNLSPQSPHGQFNGLMADALDEVWMLAENVFHSTDPLQVSGSRLDDLLTLFGLPPRRPAAYSGIEVQFIGAAGVTIPQGTSVTSSTSSVVLFTDGPIILDSLGEGTVTASPSVEGAVNVSPNEMDIITVPIENVTSVNNAAGGIIGVLVTAAETDAEIRLRILGRTGGEGVSTSNSALRLENILRGLSGVVESVLYVNNTGAVDDRGIPGHSYAAVVEGGEDITIANTIFLHHCAGIGTYGSTSVSIQDSQGLCRKINFSRPRDAIALLNITVRYVDSRCGCQPHEIDGLKTLLINLLNENRADCGGFGIGQPLIRSRLFAAFSNVPGLEIVSLQMAKHHYVFSMDCTEPAWDARGFCDGEWQKDIVWTNDSIPIAWNEKALFVEQGITLTVLDKFDNTIVSDCE